jgi:phosphoglycolate phosphatase
VRAFDLIMFDLDGTLVETAPEIMDAVNDTLRHFGLPEVMQQQVNDWIGHGTRELMVQALAQVTRSSINTVRSSQLLGQIMPVYDCFYKLRCGSRSRLFPHVLEALTTLRAQGIKLAVVTNKEGRYTQVVLDVHQLTPLFDAVVSGDTLSSKKPNPMGVAQCLAQFGVTQARALFVGDSSIDAETARNAGVSLWLLPYGYNMGQSIADCAPDRLIADFSELLN